MKLFLTLIFTIVSFQTFSQEWRTLSKKEYEELLKPMKTFMEGGSYSFNTHYKSFIGHQSIKVHDESSGVYIKNKNDYFSGMPGQAIIQENNIKLVIDSADRELVIIDAEQDVSPVFNQAVYEYTMSSAKRCEVKEIKGEKTIRIILKENTELDKYEITIDAKGFITSITSFYSEKVPFDPNDENSPADKLKLVISFSDYKSGVIIPEKYKLNKALAFSNGRYAGIGALKTFEIADYRFKTKSR